MLSSNDNNTLLHIYTLLLLSYNIFEFSFFYKKMKISSIIHHILFTLWSLYGYYIKLPGYIIILGLMDFSSLLFSIIFLYKPKNNNFINSAFVIVYFIFRLCLPIYLLFYTMSHEVLSLNDSIKTTNKILVLALLLNIYWFYKICIGAIKLINKKK